MRDEQPLLYTETLTSDTPLHVLLARFDEEMSIIIHMHR